ncbi:hypothetical protein M430DRAFT_110469, partial [Amorphotheca resinae ATCC 22711]
PILITIKDIRVFLGFTRFYRRFIKNYLKITILLTNLFYSNAASTVILSSEALEAFYKLRLVFVKASFLRYYNPKLLTRVEIDISTTYRLTTLNLRDS